MKIDINLLALPGIRPEARVKYGPLVMAESYTAIIRVVGSYEERGYGHEETITVERIAWEGDIAHSTEAQAVEEAVDKLAGMLGKLAGML